MMLGGGLLLERKSSGGVTKAAHEPRTSASVGYLCGEPVTAVLDTQLQLHSLDHIIIARHVQICVSGLKVLAAMYFSKDCFL